MEYFVKSILLILALATCTQCLDPIQLRLIDYLIEDRFIPNNNATGVGLSVTIDGETVISKGYGKRDIENNLDVQNNTLFLIGSITKSFMGVLAVKTLSEKFPTYGEAVLDLPIASLNPSFNFTFSDRFRAEATSFRDLLSHRTCLADGIELLFGSMKSAQEYNYRTRYQTQVCGHRAGYIYNNALFALVGELIASIEGIPLEDMTRNLMREIGMTDSTTIDVSGSYEDLPNMGQSYYQFNGQIHKHNIKMLKRIDMALGAGGIISTPTDMTKYANFHLNKGKVEDRQIVSEEALSWMYKASNSVPLLTGRQDDSELGPTGHYGYGLGLQLALYNGYSVIQHGGYWPPYNSGFYLFPAKNIGIFLSTNGPGRLPSPTHENIALTIFDIITNGAKERHMPNLFKPLKFTYEDMDTPLENSKLRFLKSNKLKGIRQSGNVKIEFDDVIGVYGEELAGDLTITLDPSDNNFLQMNYGQWGIGRLFPIPGSETKFSIGWKTTIMQHFYTYPQPPLPPVFSVEFNSPYSVDLLADDVPAVRFMRNATIDTFPVLPWDPTSCGPPTL